MLHTARDKALQGLPLLDAEIRQIIDLPPDRLPELMRCAREIKEARYGNRVSLCAIINARSGACSENCSFCAQSSHHHAEPPEHDLLPPEAIGQAARLAASEGAGRFGIVTSGKLVSSRMLDGLALAVRAVADGGIRPDLSPGILDQTQFKILRRAGLQGYHHNLETSATFFPHMCTTHTYEEDVAAVRAGLAAGLHVCSGGIFGIGETWDDRVELALLLRGLGVHSVPMNFLHPIPGTPLEDRPVLKPDEALKIVALFRFLLPDRQLRICGGRPTVFGEGWTDLFSSGASGLMIGDYLTVKGGDVDTDLAKLNQAGLVPDTEN